VFLAVLSLLGGGFVFGAIRNWWISVLVAAACLGATALLSALRPAAFDGLIVRVLVWFSLVGRYSSFSRGVLSVGPILYYLSFCATFVFLTVRVIDRRRWA
jgi:ABC-2 type transport system permease protein